MVATDATHHADRVHAAISSDNPARSALAASWRRSAALHHLDPTHGKPPRRITDGELRLAQERIGRLVSAAQVSLDRLYNAVGSAGCCVVLADREGVAVDRRGAVSDDATFNEWGLWTGSLWSEESEGTNGIGTCLVEQRTLTVHRDQHFFARNTLLSCTTTPIFDHEGNLAGALDVSSCRADLTEGFVNLISMAAVDAARRIEADHFRMAFPGARFVLAPDNAPSSLLAVDSDDLVIGATRNARVALGLTKEIMARPFPASDILGSHGREDLDGAERAALQRALARAGGNVSAAAQSLRISRATLHRKLARFGIKRH